MALLLLVKATAQDIGNGSLVRELQPEGLLIAPTSAGVVVM
jgi:hypothetical protein